MINFSEIVNKLEQASLFELSRLQSAISIMLEDPIKLDKIRAYLKPGMSVSYFDSEENRLVPVQIIEVRRTKASVIRSDNNQRWSIYLENLNLENIDVDLIPENNNVGSLNKGNLKVGDSVGWNSYKNGCEMFGVVVKLNPKRAVVKIADGGEWTIPYPMLFPVLDGSCCQSTGLLLEGEVI